VAQKAWGSATANSGGSSDPAILKLGDQNRIRLLDAGGPRKWRQHAIDGEKLRVLFPSIDENLYRGVTCPRGADGIGNAPCPLDMKPTYQDPEKGTFEQLFPISIRYAANVYDYESGEVKVLIAGKQVFAEFDATAQVGFDPTATDFIIFKMGKDRQTSYKVVRGEAGPLPKEIKPEDLHDLDKYENPTDANRIFEVLAEVGIDYDALPLPQFTLEQANQFVMPYTKHKGMTLEQLAAVDLDFMKWLYGTKREQGQYGDAVFQAMHEVLLSMGEAEPLDDMPKAPPRAQVQQASGPPAVASNGSGSGVNLPNDMVKLISPDGAEVEVPAGAKSAMLAAGFTEPQPEQPATAFPITMVKDGAEVPVDNEAVKTALEAQGFVVKGEDLENVPGMGAAPVEPADNDEVVIDINGTRASMQYAQAKGLIASGAATLVESAASEPQLPPLPADDDEVQVKLNALPTPIAMAFKDARPIVGANQGTFVDENLPKLIQAHAADEHAEQIREDAQQGKVEDTSDPAAQAQTGNPLDKNLTEGPNAAGKFTHPALPGKEYATKGAVTQALNRLAQSGGATADSASSLDTGAPAASPAAGDGGLLEQAKQLLAQSPQWMADFEKLMELFNEVAGKRNISDFTEDELRKLIERLRAEPAAA
jgi:hypothetical protein